MNIFIVLMVIYIVAMLILGYLGSKRATDSTSYATSNGDVSVFNVSITFAATFASAGTFLGVAGQGFAYGLTNFWFWASQWTSAGIIMAIIVRRYRRMNSMKQSATVADWIADRYHSQGLRVWLAIVSLAQVAFIASQLVGAGIIINQMIPSISYKMGVLISAIVIIIYICMGGSYAHIYTNIAQGLMMTVLGDYGGSCPSGRDRSQPCHGSQPQQCRLSHTDIRGRPVCGTPLVGAEPAAYQQGHLP